MQTAQIKSVKGNFHKLIKVDILKMLKHTEYVSFTIMCLVSSHLRPT